MSKNILPYKGQFLRLFIAFILILHTSAYGAAHEAPGSCEKARWSGNIFYAIDEDNLYRALRYIPSDKKLLSKIERKEYVDIFYDSPDLSILNSGSALYIRQSPDLPPSHKNFEKIILDIRSKNNQKKDRLIYKTKYYRNKTDGLSRHRLFGSAKRSVRADLVKQVSNIASEADILSLKPSISVSRDRISHTYHEYTIPYAEIYLDKISITSHNLTESINIAGYELYDNVPFFLGDDSKDKITTYLAGSACELAKNLDVRKKYHNMGYQEYMAVFNEYFPSYPFFRKYPWIYSIIQIIILTLIGILFFALVKNRTKNTSVCSNLKLDNYE